MKWVLASHNKGKLAEFSALLTPLRINMISQADLGVESIEETGLSFIENAIIKARHAAKATGLPALADDSGLDVPSLGGAPGIYSARYAGPLASSVENNAKLVNELASHAKPIKAFFRCILVLMRNSDDPFPLIGEGSWEGEITLTPKGSNGFGYDPLFYLPDLKRTAAELEASEKNALSHRSRAWLDLKTKWIAEHDLDRK